MYNPLKDHSEQSSQSSEDYDQLLSKESQDLDPSLRRKSSDSPTRVLLPIFLSIVLSLSTFALGTWLGSHKFADLNGRCMEHVQKYSPILSEVDTSLHNVRFNGSLMKENVFRQSAGPEVDAAWESLGVNYRSIAIPAHEAVRTGLSPTQVKISPKYGGGYPANVEGLHHLHCLNLLRQTLYFNHEHYSALGQGAFKNKENIVRFHVTHCLDIIRQQLMCMPDTGVLGQVWWDKSAPKAFVDFNTLHTCKNFEGIRKWAEERQIPETVAEDFLEVPKEGDVMFDEIP